MAKAKFPKKSNGVKETLPTITSNPTAPTDTNFGPTEAPAASPDRNQKDRNRKDRNKDSREEARNRSKRAARESCSHQSGG